MAAPVVVISGAMVAAPALMTAPPAHPAAAAKTSPHTITAHLDAVVQPAAGSYTVQDGDTLYGIALRYYGNGTYWPGLYQANQSTISNPNLIYTGQVLTIPPSQEAATAPAPALSASDPSASSASSASSSSASSSSASAPSASSASTSDPSASASAPSASAPSASAPSASAPSAPAPAPFAPSAPAPAPSAPAPAPSAPSAAPTAAASQGGSSTLSSSGGSSAVESDVADGNYLLAIGQYLVDNGYSAAAAAGVASCIDGESGGNPESEGSGGGGLIGWTPLGSATPNANIITGNPSVDMMTQLADVLYYNSNEIGQAQVDELNSQTDPVAAADFFSQNFEKPAVTDSDVVPSVAEQVFSELGG